MSRPTQDCSALEAAACRLFIAVLRDASGQTQLEYDSADQSIYVYADGFDGFAITHIDLTRHGIEKLDAARRQIETRPANTEQPT